ncbi:hypothetical protein NUU61_002590 [Penicillium alfredii]|uniref:Aminoglycoside phosphotransferase domain-containing protein n=1 Tax=Penicillium alfredii TaxID=1506179 RepID=A0A9W9FRZ7_9EURO|nr:uncharacterized protein NUU61_002590 [Penicillium alfredii]KAJ5105243.1 hypothetical protein NUU61_002590 [Penicillium alfredii]
MDTQPPMIFPAEDFVMQQNRDLVQEFQRALETNPAADLMALIPSSYLQRHRNAHIEMLETETAKLNQRTLNRLQDMLRVEPEVDLRAAFPSNYARRLGFAAQSSKPKDLKPTEPRGPPDFRKRLDLVETASIIFPLSDDATTVLASFSDFPSDPICTEQSLLSALRKMTWESEKIWESPIRGVVMKLNDDLVVKVITNKGDYTEYTAMQYLAEQAPEIPAPRPHGLIRFGSYCAIFMSYIPSMTLTEAWPNLPHEERVSVQHQLDCIFSRLRTLRKDDGHCLGGVGGEGVKEPTTNTIISTPAGFEDLKFSARHHGSNTYIKLLRTLPTEFTQGSVFTHGDVRQDNIMVKLDQDGVCTVTGIIDWEDSGFYPEYHECTQLTRTLSVVDEDDWYLYLPASISPLKFPLHWLVDRLWNIHLKTT